MNPPVKTDEVVKQYTIETLKKYEPYHVWYRVLGRANTPAHTKYMQDATKEYTRR